VRSLRLIAFLFGLAFIFAGIAGFIPSLTSDGYLLSIFSVDPLHNIIHIVSGVIALIAASSMVYSRWFFIIFGFIYAAIAMMGFTQNEAMNSMMMGMHMNMADNFLHLFIAIFALFLGFTFKAKS
jgi:hypothetical protein